MPRAEVYSLKPLSIGSDAVKEVKVGSGDTSLYRYDGLRLLMLSGGRFFFLHDGWTPRNGTAIGLPDGSVLFAKRGSVGISGLTGSHYAADQHYLLNSIRTEISGRSN